MLNIKHPRFFPTLNKLLRTEPTKVRCARVGGKTIGFNATDSDWVTLKAFAVQNRMPLNDLLSYVLLNGKLAPNARTGDVVHNLANMIREREDKEFDDVTVNN